eukprot:2963995-Pleurochrysis_carterae.AAC.1
MRMKGVTLPRRHTRRWSHATLAFVESSYDLHSILGSWQNTNSAGRFANICLMLRWTVTCRGSLMSRLVGCLRIDVEAQLLQILALPQLYSACTAVTYYGY